MFKKNVKGMQQNIKAGVLSNFSTEMRKNMNSFEKLYEVSTITSMLQSRT